MGTFVFKKAVCHLCCAYMFYGAVHHVGVQFRVVKVQRHANVAYILDRWNRFQATLKKVSRITADLLLEMDMHFFFEERPFKRGSLVVQIHFVCETHGNSQKYC